jgi:tetratricopeptide (TPR) repeat protein
LAKKQKDDNRRIRDFFKRLARGTLKAGGAAGAALASQAGSSASPETAAIVGTAAVVGVLTPLLDEAIFGTLQDEAAHKEKEKLHQALEKVKEKLDQRDTDLTELLVGQCVQYQLNRKTLTEIKKVSRLIKDPDNAPIPASIANARSVIDAIEGKLDEQTQILMEEIKELPKRIRPSVKKRGPKKRFINNIPYPSIGGLFKGRADIIENLKKRLAANKAAAITQIPAIHGLGGVGKTRLAVEFGWWAVRNKKYRDVLFVSSEKPELINSSLVKLADEDTLNLPGEKEDEQLASVLRWLNDNDNWLLVFDNADSEQSAKAVEDLLPKLSAGRVIITSRYTRWSGSVEPHSLDLLEPEEAKQFLLDRTKGRRIKTGQDEKIAAQLTEMLGYLPLALEQAGAFIAHNKCSMAEYLRDWENKRQDVLEWYDKRQMQYDASIAVTWQRTFDRLDVPAKAILNISSHLAPELIPEQMFEEGADILKEAIKLLKKEKAKSPSKVKIRDAISQLAAYSMVTRQEDGFTVHRLVQQVILSRIPKARRNKWLDMALRIVDNYAPTESDDVRTWPILDCLRPHAELIAESADEAEITDPTSRLMSVIGIYLHAKGLHNQAEHWMRRALTIDEASFGPDHPNVAFDLNNLAELLSATNRFDEAEPMYRRALAIDESSFGPDHPKVAIRLNNLAQLLQETGRLDDVEPLMRRALKIDEASFGPDHPNVAIDLNNLALLLKTTNRLAEAEPLMRRALKIDEASFGPDHPNVAIRLNNLALLLAETNRLGEAEPLMRRALKIFEASYGPDHPSTITVRENWEDLKRKMNP